MVVSHYEWVLRDAITGEPFASQVESPENPEFPVQWNGSECYWEFEKFWAEPTECEKEYDMKQRPLTMERLHRRLNRLHRSYGAPTSREIREYQKAMDAEYLRRSQPTRSNPYVPVQFRLSRIRVR